MIAANRYTTKEFLDSIRRKGNVPPANSQFGDSDLLALADDELSTALLRQIVSARENFYQVYDVLVSQGPSGGIYDIPSRAIGSGITHVSIVSVGSIARYNRSELSSPTTGSIAIIGNQVQVIGPNPSGEVQLWYLRRPNKLIPINQAAQVASVDLGAGTITLRSVPSTWSTNMVFDCIQDQPHFNWRFIDATPTNITGLVMTFAALPVDAYGSSVIVDGDWLAPAGQSPITQVPVEFIPLLVQRTVVKYYEVQGYTEKYKLAQKKLEDMEKDVFDLINPRVQTAPKRIIASSWLNGARSWKGYTSA